MSEENKKKSNRKNNMPNTLQEHKENLGMASSYSRYLSFLKSLLNVLILLAGFLWLMLTMRQLTASLIWIPTLLHRYTSGWRKVVLLICSWALFYASSVAPFDISFVNYPGPPRFVPLIMGLPTPEGRILILRHEAIWGGCLRRGNEPKFVWVW